MRNDCLLALLPPWRAEEGLSAIRVVYIQGRAEEHRLQGALWHNQPTPLGNRDFDTIKRWTEKSHVPHKGQLFLKNQVETVLTKGAGRRA